tara:strand:- start:196 stop:438 length:243 start_codon:yes stop_codon:yes gene_type:complete
MEVSVLLGSRVRRFGRRRSSKPGTVNVVKVDEGNSASKPTSSIASMVFSANSRRTERWEGGAEERRAAGFEGGEEEEEEK